MFPSPGGCTGTFSKFLSFFIGERTATLHGKTAPLPGDDCRAEHSATQFPGCFGGVPGFFLGLGRFSLSSSEYMLLEIN